MGVPESGKLQCEFHKSANTMMDQDISLALIGKKIESMAAAKPSDFENAPEYKRRATESLGRLLGDEYMLSVQNKKPFNLKDTLNGIPDTATPNDLNKRAAIIENRVITASEKIDPSKRLTNGTENQQKFLEDSATQITEEASKSGISPTGAAKIAAGNSYAKNLSPADVANYTMLTDQTKIPKETLNAMAETPSPSSNTPSPSAEISAPATKSALPMGCR